MIPSPSASSSRPIPISQLISRGRRNAPVKKMRARWTAIAPRNTSAVQWWTWRMSSPDWTSNDSRITDAYAADIGWPSITAYGPW